MDIAAIRYVLEVEKTGSINIAARNLYQSPPTLSYAIKTLENQLGGELFTRSNKGMVLTELGRQFVGYAQPFYQQYKFLAEISGSLAPERPSLAVVSSPQKTVSNIFVQMCEAYAGESCNFSFEEIPVEEVLEKVHDNLADVGVVIFVSPWKKTLQRLMKLKNLTYTPLTREQPQVIVRSGHPLCKKQHTHLTLKQLEKYPYITNYVGAFQYSYEDYNDEVAVLGRHGKIVVHNRAAMYDILHNTDAYSISSYNRTAFAGRYDDGIATFPLQPVNFHLELGWVKPKATELSPIGKDFIDRLTASLKDYQ